MKAWMSFSRSLTERKVFTLARSLRLKKHDLTTLLICLSNLNFSQDTDTLCSNVMKYSAKIHVWTCGERTSNIHKKNVFIKTYIYMLMHKIASYFKVITKQFLHIMRLSVFVFFLMLCHQKELGVFTTEVIHAGTHFGPLLGEHLTPEHLSANIHGKHIWMVCQQMWER